MAYPHHDELPLQGPSRLIQQGIDKSSVNYSRGVGPRRQGIENRYGEEGAGWEMIEATPETPEDYRNQQLGRLPTKILVTVEGEAHAWKIGKTPEPAIRERQ